jgi:phenylpropionate dioxygenase-like ring-hydroxylating dioxygenase large terminal subunit
MNLPELEIARCPAESYEDLLDRDTRPVPAHLREQPVRDVGVDAIPASHFFDPAYHRKEVAHLWSRVWQWACREEDIPNVGDCYLYEIVDKSVIIVRTAPSEIKAFYNSCLHRGRKLITSHCHRNEFKCPYHGMTWARDGRFVRNPIEWDFPQWAGQANSLPELKLEIWAGFVFVNFDDNAAALRSVIGPLMDHFERYDYGNRYVTVNLSKVVRANWKIVAEAFMESHHSLTTHPQIIAATGDANAQYDFLNDYVSRHFVAAGVPSPNLEKQPSELDIVAYMMSRYTTDRNRRALPAGTVVPESMPEGLSARKFMGDVARRGLEERTGRSFTHASDAELMDAIQYGVFPHMSFWASFGPSTVYRWRPYGNDPDMSIMDILILAPVPEGKPRPATAKLIQLGPDDHPEIAKDSIGQFANVFAQDLGNLPHVQTGVKASKSGLVHYGRYTEMRIRYMHQMIDRFISEGEAELRRAST